MKQLITINGILDGYTSTRSLGRSTSYDGALGVDPDLPLSGKTKTSGAIVPSRYEKFSGANITGSPMWTITNPEDTNVYTYSDDGKFVRYDKNLANETALTAPTSGAGNGAVYYNNYIYLATPTNVARYGPMDGTPSMTQNAWTSAVLGSQTALANFTYPSLNGVKVPNHVMHAHGDNSVYFSDVVDGKGVLHKIITTKTAVNGDTDDGSAYNVLDLPAGFIITDIESYSTDIAILAIQTRDGDVNQGRAALFFWDAVNTDTFYRGPVFLADPLATALININGVLHIFSGNSQNGVRISRYIGGESVQEVLYMEDGLPPFAGAVDILGNRTNWGGVIQHPDNKACVMAYGSKRGDLPKGLHNVVKTSSSGNNPITTSVKYVQQDSNVSPKMVVGWKDDTTQGIDKSSSTATYSSEWRSKIYTIGKKFRIDKIRIPFGAKVLANMSLTVTALFDDETKSKELTTITNTTDPNEWKKIFKQPELGNNDVIGENEFLIKLSWAGTVELPVTFPIEIEITTFDDEQ